MAEIVKCDLDIVEIYQNQIPNLGVWKVKAQSLTHTHTLVRLQVHGLDWCNKNQANFDMNAPGTCYKQELELVFCRKCCFVLVIILPEYFFLEILPEWFLLHNVIIPVKYSLPCKPTDQIPSPIPTGRLDSVAQCDNILNHDPDKIASTTGNAMKITV